MARLSRIPRNYLSLHPLRGSKEHQITAANTRDEGYSRFHQPSGPSIDLHGQPVTNRVIMVINFGQSGGGVWRIHICRALWSSTQLERTILDIEPLFELHPLAWGSDAHRQVAERWAEKNQVGVTIVQDSPGNIILHKPSQD